MIAASSMPRFSHLFNPFFFCLFPEHRRKSGKYLFLQLQRLLSSVTPADSRPRKKSEADDEQRFVKETI